MISQPAVGTTAARLKVIIFDVDGVLVNGELFSERLARDHRILTEQTAPFFSGVFGDCLTGEADLKEVIPAYLDEWGWTGGVDTFLEYWFTAEHAINQELVDYAQTLRAMGIKCVVATNNEKHRVDYMLDTMGFSRSFDRLYASADLGHRKPAMEFYAAVLEDLGVEKNDVLFFDDTEENVAAAKAFGINAELYTGFDHFKSTLQQYL